jgi:hypothetical protein
MIKQVEQCYLIATYSSLFKDKLKTTQNLPCATARSRTLTQTVKLIFIEVLFAIAKDYLEKDNCAQMGMGRQYLAPITKLRNCKQHIR